jgi:hypothetical protein
MNPMHTPAPAGGRNLVVCCDGTGNIWGNSRDTNVVRLVRACVQDDRQIVYYDPGVGTATDYPGVAVVDSLKLRLKRVLGLAFGGGIYENIAGAYLFLVRHWQPGDRIFVLGFSRGAFTARAVAGMVNLFGIVRPHADTMVPALLRVYFGKLDAHNARGQTRDDLARDIREHFATPAGAVAEVHFIGAFDTVASVGGLLPRHITSDSGLANKRFVHVRHAVSIDEYRAPYQPRLYQSAPVPFTDPARPSVEQRWFAGVHSDVGGSYARRGLADGALVWMADAACQTGLRLLPGAGAGWKPEPQAAAHDEVGRGWFGSLWALAGLQHRTLPRAFTEAERAACWARHAAVEAAALRRLAVMGAAVFALLVLMHLQTGALDGAGQASSLGLARLQLGAAWAASADWAPYRTPGLARVLWLDGLLIAAYTLLSCQAVALALRRWRTWRRDEEAPHRRLRVFTQAALIAAPLADALENLLTACAAAPDAAPAWALALSLASATKTLALAAATGFVLLTLALSRWLRGPAPAAISHPP